MSPASGSEDRSRKTGELRSLFQQFVEQLSTDHKLSDHLTAWSRANGLWRSHWAGRSTMSHDRTFARLLPNPAGETDRWVHPMAVDAPELRAWHAEWEKAPRADRDEFSSICVRVIASIERDPESLPGGCEELERAAGKVGLPLATFTPALSALDPERYVVMCDAWGRSVGQYGGGQLSASASDFPDVNKAAMRLLTDAEDGVTLPVVLHRARPAERFGVFCSWLGRANSEPAGAARFDVTQRKYKDWPPMW